MNRYYKKYDIIDGQYYQSPSWTKKEFKNVKSREIKIQDGDRLDIIAEQLYNDPSLWKALAAFNGLGDFFELRPGDSLYLPINIKDVLDQM